jgi:hypothetical protein
MPKKSKTSMPSPSALEPLHRGLPTETAAAIGAIVARHAYIDWLLGQVMYSLMEISIKQGRVIMKLPRPRVFICAVEDLFEFHGLEKKFDFEGLAKKLERADRVRRELTRSVYMRDTDSHEMRILLARSHWDPGPGGELQPELEELDRGLLSDKRKVVDEAVKGAEKLQSVTNKLLRKAYENRRTRPALNRRK